MWITERSTRIDAVPKPFDETAHHRLEYITLPLVVVEVSDDEPDVRIEDDLALSAYYVAKKASSNLRALNSLAKA